MTIKNVYIAGPMRGIKDFNFPAFDKAEAKLTERGFHVFNPASRDRKKHGKDVGKSKKGDLKDAEKKGFDLRKALAEDLGWICRYADAIYLLHGWEKSRGATAERAVAFALGLDVMYEDDELRGFRP